MDFVAGQDRLYVDEADSSGNDSREVSIGAITVMPAHDAGNLNLQPQQIVSIGAPVWNPDGTKLAVVVSRAAGQSQILVVDAQSGDAVTASPQLDETDDPDWTPDGLLLSYVHADAGFTNRRLAITSLASGETHDVPATEGMDIVAHRWDETSAGLYIARAHASEPADIVHSNPETGDQTLIRVTPTGLTQDLTRFGGRLWSLLDNDFTALASINPQDVTGETVRTDAASARAPFYGWYLSSPGLIAVEEIGNTARKPPLIAEFKPQSVPGDRFEYFSVNAPVAFKWDVYAPP